MIPLKDNIPTRRFPVLTVAIIAINVIVYFLFQDGKFSTVNEEFVVDYGVIPYELTHPGDHCEAVGQGIACEGQEGVTGQADAQPSTPITLLSSIFMHASLIHLGGNMLFLWIFGNNIEDSMGRVRFVAFYLLGGLAATLAQTAVNPDAAIPTIGASGAVAAVLGAYALLYPRARVVTLVIIIFFITVIQLPALLVLGAWFVLQLLDGTRDLGVQSGDAGVAYWAHIGGFVFGLALIRLFANRVHEDYDSPQRLAIY